MQKLTLPNGIKVLFEKKQGNAVVIQVMVKVGSNDEAKSERGISHFLEHMLFEGTVKRPNNWEISNEIEKIGGDFNAYTTSERTCYYIKVLKKHFSTAVEILADIFQNSIFKEEHIVKERNIVLKEIDMVYDEPRFYQWILLQKYLFEKHPSKNPTYGDRTVIKNLSRKKTIDYFKKHYVPENIVISVVGDIPNWKKEIKEKFVLEKSPLPKKEIVKEPISKKVNVKKEKRKIANTYLVLGFKTIPRTHPDSPVFDVINGILGRGQSGRMFTEIRGKRGLAYDVGTQNISESSFGYFAIYATINKKNIHLVRNLVLKELQRLKTITINDVKESQNFIEGDYLLELEDTQKVADQILFWENVKNADLLKNFIKKIKKVTPADIKRVVEKYYKNYTMVVLEGK